MATNQMSRHSKRPKPTKKSQGQEKKSMCQEASILHRLLSPLEEWDLSQAFQCLLISRLPVPVSKMVRGREVLSKKPLSLIPRTHMDKRQNDFYKGPPDLHRRMHVHMHRKKINM